MKKLLLIATVLLLYGCPGENDCDDFGRIAEINSLVKVNLPSNQFRQGTVITLTLEVPSTNNYFGSQLDLFEQTGDNTALLIFTGRELFIGNETRFVKGFLDSDVSLFGVPYNPSTQNYELEVEITLNKLGVYQLDVFQHRVDFIGSNCNRFFIDTTTEGTEMGPITFEVIP